MFSRLWDTLVRWRTWLINVAGAVLLALPDLLMFLHSPELMSVLPPGWQKWLALALLVANIWMRPRPASRAADPEVKVKKALKRVDDATVVVKADGETKAVIEAPK